MLISTSPAGTANPRTRHAANGFALPLRGGPVADTLRLLGDALSPQRRTVRAGDAVFRSGERFDCLFVLNSGQFKIVASLACGRDKLSGFKFRGDWLGFDGIATRRYACDAIAMDTGEVWAFRYDALLAAGAKQPELLALLHDAMSREINTDMGSLMAVCTMPADARVANFLHFWAESLARHGLRSDQITLRMTRAEIGAYLGMTLETVSRALSRLTRGGLIRFAGTGRREIFIPDVGALADFVRRSVAPAPKLR